MPQTVDLLFRDLKMDLLPELPSFSLDPVLLVRNTPQASCHRMADLGSGTGIIPLMLWDMALSRQVESSVVGFEREPLFLENCRRTLQNNPQVKGVTFLDQDLRLNPPEELMGSFDLVLSNPPFLKKGQGRLPENPAKLAVNFETDTSLQDFMTFAFKLLRPGGLFGLIMRWDRLQETLTLAGELALGPRSLRFVHSSSKSPARAFILFMSRGNYSGTLTIEKPLLVHRDDSQEYSDEVAGYFSAAQKSMGDCQ